MSKYTVCILGKRQSNEKNLFIETLKIFSEVLIENGFYTQTRTLGWPSPNGLLDKAVTRISDQSIIDLQIPKKYDILFLIDQYESISEKNISTFLNQAGYFIRNTIEESVEIKNNFTKININFDKIQDKTNPHILAYTIHKLFDRVFLSKKKNSFLNNTNYPGEKEFKLKIDSFFDKKLFDSIRKKQVR